MYIFDIKKIKIMIFLLFYRQKLKAIASSASNTWGLFLLVLLLGYALVEVPRKLWNGSKPGYTLNYSYFKVAKLSLDKCEAEETVDDILEVYTQHYLQIALVVQEFCNVLRNKKNKLILVASNCNDIYWAWSSVSL